MPGPRKFSNIRQRPRFTFRTAGCRKLARFSATPIWLGHCENWLRPSSQTREKAGTRLSKLPVIASIKEILRRNLPRFPRRTGDFFAMTISPSMQQRSKRLFQSITAATGSIKTLLPAKVRQSLSRSTCLKVSISTRSGTTVRIFFTPASRPSSSRWLTAKSFLAIRIS